METLGTILFKFKFNSLSFIILWLCILNLVLSIGVVVNYVGILLKSWS